MIDRLLNEYLTVIAVVFSILLVLQLVKRAIGDKVAIPGIVWWIAAWALGVGAALITSEDCAEKTWRCFAEPALIYGGAAIVIYPLMKELPERLRKLLLGDKP